MNYFKDFFPEDMTNIDSCSSKIISLIPSSSSPVSENLLECKYIRSKSWDEYKRAPASENGNYFIHYATRYLGKGEKENDVMEYKLEKYDGIFKATPFANRTGLLNNIQL